MVFRRECAATAKQGGTTGIGFLYIRPCRRTSIVPLQGHFLLGKSSRHPRKGHACMSRPADIGWIREHEQEGRRPGLRMSPRLRKAKAEAAVFPTKEGRSRHPRKGHACMSRPADIGWIRGHEQEGRRPGLRMSPRLRKAKAEAAVFPTTKEA